MDSRPDKHPITHVRDAHDAQDDKALKRDPGHEEGKLDVGLDESFPSSDPASATQPGRGDEPAPSSGYDEREEKARKPA